MAKGNWRKKIAILIAVIACVFAVITFYIQNRVTKKIEDASGISCNKISVNLLSGCMDLHDLEIVHNLENEEQLTLKSTKVHIHGLSYWKYLRQNKVVIKDFIFENLDIALSPSLKKQANLPQEESAENDQPSEIFIHTFQIADGKISVNKESAQEIRVDSFTTQVRQLQFFPDRDSAKLKWSESQFLGRGIYVNPNENYNLWVDEVFLSGDEKLEVSNFKWQAKRNKENFVKPLACRKGRLDVQVPHLHISPFSIADILFEDKFIANSIVVENGNLEIFSDKNKVACTDTKQYFYEVLAASDFKIHVDSIAVKNTNIIFEELRENEEEIGHLNWNNVYASIYDLSNVSEFKKVNTHVNIQAKFIEDSHVKLNLKFPNFNPERAYTFDGSLDHIKLTKLNRFLNFSKRLRINAGELNELKFAGTGNLQSTSGTMELLYGDLGIDLLKKDGSRRKVLSKLSNLLISNKNNPNAKNELRKGKMYSERVAEKSFISNWWMTLQSGMKSTILPNVLLPDELDVEE